MMQLHLSNGNIITISQEAAKFIVEMIQADEQNILIKMDEGGNTVEFMVRISSIVAIV